MDLKTLHNKLADPTPLDGNIKVYTEVGPIPAKRLGSNNPSGGVTYTWSETTSGWQVNGSDGSSFSHSDKGGGSTSKVLFEGVNSVGDYVVICKGNTSSTLFAYTVDNGDATILKSKTGQYNPAPVDLTMYQIGDAYINDHSSADVIAGLFYGAQGGTADLPSLVEQTGLFVVKPVKGDFANKMKNDIPADLNNLVSHMMIHTISSKLDLTTATWPTLSFACNRIASAEGFTLNFDNATKTCTLVDVDGTFTVINNGIWQTQTIYLTSGINVTVEDGEMSFSESLETGSVVQSGDGPGVFMFIRSTTWDLEDVYNLLLELNYISLDGSNWSYNSTSGDLTVTFPFFDSTITKTVNIPTGGAPDAETIIPDVHTDTMTFEEGSIYRIGKSCTATFRVKTIVDNLGGGFELCNWFSATKAIPDYGTNIQVYVISPGTTWDNTFVSAELQYDGSIDVGFPTASLPIGTEFVVNCTWVCKGS